MSDSSEPRPIVRMVHHLARSGGTLFSRCLASMRGVTLLSEIHPRGAPIALQFDPLYQAQYWFKLISPEEADVIREAAPSFGEVMGILALRAAERGERLVLRDWSHLDFMAKPFIDQPSGRLTLADEVGMLCDLRQVATVRHPAAQWRSLTRFLPASGITLDEFLASYRAFAQQALVLGFLRYEDLLRDPGGTMREMCGSLELDFDPEYANRWCFYRNVGGDTRSFDRFTIEPSPAPAADPELSARLEQSDDYQRAMSLLGYVHETEEEPATAAAR